MDVVGFKGNRTIAIECGRTKYSKLEKLRTVFENVEHFRYTGRIYPKMRNLRISQISATKAISKLFQKGKSQVPLMVRLALKIRDDDTLVWYQQNNRVFLDKAGSIIGISYVYGGGKTHIPADVGKILCSKDGDRLLWKLESGKIVVEVA